MRSSVQSVHHAHRAASSRRRRPLLGLLLLGLACLSHAEAPRMDPRVHIHLVGLSEPGRWDALVSLLSDEHVLRSGLPGPAIIGRLREHREAGAPLTPDNLEVNDEFVDFLHDIIARETPNDPAFQRAVKRQRDGWMYVIDRRTPTPAGEVPAEDILGAFRIENGEAVPGSYQRMKTHRIVSERGLFQLDDYLQPKLIEALRALGTDAQ